jgi:hypothetical protein
VLIFISADMQHAAFNQKAISVKLNALQDFVGRQADIQKSLNDLDRALPLYKEHEQLCHQLGERPKQLRHILNERYHRSPRLDDKFTNEELKKQILPLRPISSP